MMQRYFSYKFNNNKFTLSDDDMYHIKRVMRMVDGDMVEVVYEKDVYLCKLDRDSIECFKKLEHVNTFTKEVTLCVPLLKEQKMDYILQKATELGVARIIPIILERSIIKLDKDKEEKRISRWTKICKEASEQSMRNSIPVISKVSMIDALKGIDGLKILCSTREKEKTIKKVLQSASSYDKIIVVVGPEGGITELEEQKLIESGFIPTSLGSGILRAETAPLFVLSILNYENME